jgi:hypothetical protein
MVAFGRGYAILQLETDFGDERKQLIPAAAYSSFTNLALIIA